MIRHVPRYLRTWRPFRGPQGRKGCTRRLVRNQLTSQLKSLQVSRLSCILNMLDLMGMLLDLGHISVACLLVPVENENKKRTEKEKGNPPIWKRKRRTRREKKKVRCTPSLYTLAQSYKPDEPHALHSCRAGQVPMSGCCILLVSPAFYFPWTNCLILFSITSRPSSVFQT